jgi:hypothetical protein
MGNAARIGGLAALVALAFVAERVVRGIRKRRGGGTDDRA